MSFQRFGDPVLLFLLKFRTVARDTRRQMSEAQLLLTASSLAYITILSLVPILAVSFAIFQAFGGLDKLYDKIEPLILSNLAEGTSDVVIAHAQRFIQNVHTTTVGAGGFAGLVVTTIGMLSNVEGALNRIWRVPNTRSFFHRLTAYWLFLTLGPLAISISVGAATSSRLWVISHLFPEAWVSFVVATCLLAAVYKYVPCCWVRWKYALLAAAVTISGFDLTRELFKLYISRFATFNRVYGSVAAVPIFLIWIYLIWVIVLTGAALNAALQKRLERPRITSGGKPGAPA